ncbi:hypothetical protein G3T14_06710 [Methylobacterium sp. BTF04]|nr:hypothetical protein [Methylobacterium sp. BTF04]
MMPLAIDPSEMRAPARPAKAPAPRRAVGRPIALALLGCVGLVGLSAGCYAMLSGLAGPQVIKNQAARIKIGPMAVDMPDLRDGVPALAPIVTTSRPPPPSEPVTLQAGVSPASPITTLAAIVPDRPGTGPVTLEAPKPDLPAKTARVLPLENAALVPPARIAPLIPAARTAALVVPSSGETKRARISTTTSFAALPPEPASAETPSPRKKPAPAIVRAKVSPPTHVATAAPSAQPSAEPEAEETEVFGMKVPSLAPAGRKFVEGVQALGDAVKSWPDKF